MDIKKLRNSERGKKTKKQMNLNDFSKSKIIYKKRILFWNSIVFIKYILILNVLNNIFSKNVISLIKFDSSKIILTIKRSGDIMIFSSETNFFKTEYYPDEVTINGATQEIVNHTYTFSEINNKVELKWINSIDDTSHMFRSCSDIDEIDLSNFDNSQVTNMAFMFYSCQYLTSINFNNIVTSKVKHMNNMFIHCSRLASLDLSKFNTQNVESIRHMFYNCISLTSLDLSIFQTSKVKAMENMFYGCSKLEYINMKNFDEGA